MFVLKCLLFTARVLRTNLLYSIHSQYRLSAWSRASVRLFGFTQEELLKVYRTIVRLVADYCAVFYHSILTHYEVQELNRLQAQALKNIYGFGIPYSKMREMSELTTLRERRLELVDKFASKCLGSDCFSHWFPLCKSGRTARQPSVEEILEGICYA